MNKEKALDLDRVNYNKLKMKEFFKKNNCFDKHPSIKIGDTAYFMTGYYNQNLAKGKVKGIKGNDIYIYNDAYWYPVDFNRILEIESN